VGVGEICNFTAYAFAPASLVTPLGALSVIVAAVVSLDPDLLPRQMLTSFSLLQLASKFLNEKLNLLGKLGCFLCIIGSTIIVIHSPKEVEIEDLDVLVGKLKDPTFIIYVFVILTMAGIIAFYLGPRSGHRNVYVVRFSVLPSQIQL
jgi:magnesium transporter